MITQYSRLYNHTLTSSGDTFSVPANEDFTSVTWTAGNLGLSEIGVNEGNGRAFIRIGSNIKEFALYGSGTATTSTVTGTTNQVPVFSSTGLTSNSGFTYDINSNNPNLNIGKNNTITNCANSAIIGNNLTLANEDSVVYVNNLHVDNEVWVYSGGTIMQGITQELVIGSNKITVVNGIIVGFI